eukprot:Selendium_serpulae@DN6516_c2_g4_i7.p1
MIVTTRMRWRSLLVVGFGFVVAVYLLWLRVSQQQQIPDGRGKFKVLTFFSSNFGEMTSNWWHYLRPYAEESDVDVIAVAYSEGLCDLIPPHKNFVCKYESDLKDDTSNDTTYVSTEYLKRIHRKLDSTVEFIRNASLGDVILFTDVDVVFTANPFNYQLPRANQVDLWFSNAEVTTKPHGIDVVNSGYYYVRVTPETKSFFKLALKELMAGRTYEGGDQGAMQSALKKTRIEHEMLPLDIVLNGFCFFNALQKTTNAVAIHVNYLVYMSKKVECLKYFGMWF